MTTPMNARKEPRYRLGDCVTYRVDHGPTTRGTLHDVSRSGLGLQVEQPLAPDARVEVLYQHPRIGSTWVEGGTAYSHHCGPDFRAGVRLHFWCKPDEDLYWELIRDLQCLTPETSYTAPESPQQCRVECLQIASYDLGARTHLHRRLPHLRRILSWAENQRREQLQKPRPRTNRIQEAMDEHLLLTGLDLWIHSLTGLMQWCRTPSPSDDEALNPLLLKLEEGCRTIYWWDRLGQARAKEGED